jgi:mannosyl-oligosaccharide alpha-1,2-mannosidase
MHPDISSLPSPSSLFPEVGDIASFLQPPTYEPFPDSRIRDIISSPTVDDSAPDRSRFSNLSAEAYANTWKKPEQWKPDTGEMRKLQWDGFSTGRRDTWETKEEGDVRKERRDAVKRGFVYAWQKYKDHAWGEWYLCSGLSVVEDVPKLICRT